MKKLYGKNEIKRSNLLIAENFKGQLASDQIETRLFENIYNTYYSFVYNVVQKFVKDEFVAEELAHDIFIILWLKRSSIHIEENLKGYLFKMGKNSALSHLHSMQSRREQLISYFDGVSNSCQQVEDYISYRATNDRLQHILAKLSERQRVAFSLCKLDGFTYKEAAIQMGISVNTLKEHLGEAVRYFKKIF